MTDRTYLAGQALAGLLASTANEDPDTDADDPRDFAITAVDLADAVLARLAKTAAKTTAAGPVAEPRYCMDPFSRGFDRCVEATCGRAHFAEDGTAAPTLSTLQSELDALRAQVGREARLREALEAIRHTATLDSLAYPRLDEIARIARAALESK